MVVWAFLQINVSSCLSKPGNVYRINLSWFLILVHPNPKVFNRRWCALLSAMLYDENVPYLGGSVWTTWPVPAPAALQGRWLWPWATAAAAQDQVLLQLSRLECRWNWSCSGPAPAACSPSAEPWEDPTVMTLCGERHHLKPLFHISLGHNLTQKHVRLSLFILDSIQ